MVLYIEIQEDNVARSKQEVEQVCRVAISSLDGYDLSGFNELNKNTGGFHGGELIIITGRPGMGKSALAVNIDYAPTHIASMPVAVNICCHAARHAEGTL